MQREKQMNERIRFFIEQYHLGEISKERLEGLISPEELKTAEEELNSSDREILQHYPIHEMADAVRKKSKRTIEPSLFRLPLLAAAALLLVLGSHLFLNGGINTPPGVERIKGMEPSIRIYKAKEDQAVLLAQEDIAREFDLLQIEYNATGYPYGMILSVDGRRTVSLHYPFTPKDQPLLQSGKVLLPYSYQLDDAPDFERFFFIVSEDPFSPEEILQTLRELNREGVPMDIDRLPLGEGFQQTSIRLEKE